MRQPAYVLSVFLFIFCILIDCAAFIFYQTLGGVLMLSSTIAVFFAGHIWFIHRADGKIYWKSIFLVIPLSLICVAFIRVLKNYRRAEGFGEENLLSLGQMMMSRYQGALWTLGIFMICMFVFASSLLEKGQQK